MNRGAYLRKRARNIRHGMTRSAHGSKRRAKVADVVRMLGGPSRRVVGVDFAVPGSGSTVLVLFDAMKQQFEVLAVFAEQAMRAMSPLMSAFTSITAEFMKTRAMLAGMDAIEFAESIGAPAEVIDSLRVADTIYRLGPPEPDPSEALTFTIGGSKVAIRFDATNTASEALRAIRDSLAASEQFNARVKTINEMRNEFGMPPLPDGDHALLDLRGAT